MRTLEKQVGTALFERRGRALVPTRAAVLLYEHGRRILAARQAAVEDLDRLLHRYEGELLIGGSTIPGEYILPEIVATFRAAHPGVSVRLRVGDTSQMLEALEAGSIELAFVGAKQPSKHLAFRSFTGDELVLVRKAGRGAGAGAAAAASGSIAARELASLPFVFREPGSGTRTMLEKRLEQCGVDVASLRVIAEIGSSNGVKEAVKAGLGVTILSRRAVESELASGALAIIRVRECPRMQREFFAVTDRRRRASLVGSAFLAMALKTSRGA